MRSQGSLSYVYKSVDAIMAVKGAHILTVWRPSTINGLDWVCHIGTLTPCIEAVAQSCIIVTWWSGTGGIQAGGIQASKTSWFPSVL